MLRQEEAIFTAIRNFKNTNSTTEIQRLINAGADLTIVNDDNETPIQLARALESWECVEAIAKAKKTDKNNDKSRYGSALVLAVKENKYDTVKILLEAGASGIWHTVSDKNTCLHWAIKNKNSKMLEVLIKHDADITSKNDENDNQYTPIQLAASLGFWDGVNVIAKAKNTDIKDAAKYGSALRRAVKQNQILTVKLLINAKAPLTSITKATNNSCLHEAVRLNIPELVQVLLEAGANQLAVNSDELTPLELACLLGHWDSAEEFIHDEEFTFDNEAGAGLALIQAIKAGQLRVASYLIEACASLTVLTKNDGFTALHWAVSHNNTKAIRLLLSNESSQIALSKSDETPIELASRLGYWDSVQTLLEFELPQNDKSIYIARHYENALLYAVKAGNYAIVKLLLEHHAPCNKWNSAIGNIVLYEAVQLNRADIVSVLIEFGVDTRRLNSAGKSIYDIAMELKYDGCVRALQKHDNQIAAPSAKIELDDADVIFEKLVQNAFVSRQLPDALENFNTASIALLTNDLKKIHILRDMMNNQWSQTINATGVYYPCDEVAMLAVLIKVIQSLVNYPDNPISPLDLAIIMQMQQQGSLEAAHVVTYMNRRACVEDYVSKIRQWLLGEKKYLSENRWFVKGVFVEWTEGVPTNVKKLIEVLACINPSSSQVAVMNAYETFCDQLWKIKVSKNRHPETVSYYLKKAQEIKTFTFSGLVDIDQLHQQVSAHLQAGYSMMTNSYQAPVSYNYPSIAYHYASYYQPMQSYQVDNHVAPVVEQPPAYESMPASRSSSALYGYLPPTNHFSTYVSSDHLYPVLTGYPQDARPDYPLLNPLPSPDLSGAWFGSVNQQIAEQQPINDDQHENVKSEIKQVCETVIENLLVPQSVAQEEVTNSEFDVMMAQAPSVRDDSFRLFSQQAAEINHRISQSKESSADSQKSKMISLV